MELSGIAIIEIELPWGFGTGVGIEVELTLSELNCKNEIDPISDWTIQPQVLTVCSLELNFSRTLYLFLNVSVAPSASISSSDNTSSILLTLCSSSLRITFLKVIINMISFNDSKMLISEGKVHYRLVSSNLKSHVIDFFFKSLASVCVYLCVPLVCNLVPADYEIIKILNEN